MTRNKHAGCLSWPASVNADIHQVMCIRLIQYCAIMPWHYREDEGENTEFERMMEGSPEQSESRQESDDDEVSSSEEFEGATMDDVKASLVNYLDSIQEERTWSSCGAILINSPTPGLHLKGGDVVGLPLSPDEALRIRRHASPSSTPNNADSLGCELSLDQFELHNPAWHAFIQSVGLNAAKPFDIGPVHLTLCKLVLCDKSSDSAVREEYAQSYVTGRTVD